MSAATDSRGPWTLFKIVDAIGNEFCCTGSYADYESAFRKHADWWKRYARSARYRAKVPSHRWPVMPCRVVVEPCE